MLSREHIKAQSIDEKIIRGLFSPFSCKCFESVPNPQNMDNSYYHDRRGQRKEHVMHKLIAISINTRNEGHRHFGVDVLFYGR